MRMIARLFGKLVLHRTSKGVIEAYMRLWEVDYQIDYLISEENSYEL